MTTSAVRAAAAPLLLLGLALGSATAAPPPCRSWVTLKSAPQSTTMRVTPQMSTKRSGCHQPSVGAISSGP